MGGNGFFFFNINYENYEINSDWVNCKHYIASCELMYRSLLGYYSYHSNRLKYERWQVPSIVSDFITSFGYYDNFNVSKQFAARLKLLNAPGIVVKKYYQHKSDLIASSIAYPGYKSKLVQCQPL